MSLADRLEELRVSRIAAIEHVKRNARDTEGIKPGHFEISATVFNSLMQAIREVLE